MDPSALLMAQVAGLILVGLALTVVLVRRGRRRWRGGAAEAAVVAASSGGVPSPVVSRSVFRDESALLEGEARGVRAVGPGALVAIFCPRTTALAAVRVAAAPGVEGPELALLACEYFPDGGMSCRRECLAKAVAA